MIHALKILPEFFKAMAAGTKSFEVRKNDRPYHTGVAGIPNKSNNAAEAAGKRGNAD